MKPPAAPIADLADAIDRLDREIAPLTELEGTSLEFRLDRVQAILKELGIVARTASQAIMPAALEETRRLDAQDCQRGQGANDGMPS